MPVKKRKDARTAIRPLKKPIVNPLQRLSEHGVVIPDTKGVAGYLKAYPQLAKLLPGICEEVRRALGPRVELSLERYNDPEITDACLTLYARKEKYETDFVERLSTISEGFNHRLEEVSGYFLITTDFARP